MRKTNPDKKFSVYVHISPSNKYYVGITCQIPTRRWGSNGRTYKNNIYFWNAIQKYGWNNFQHEIIAQNLTMDEACNFEIVLISKLKSNNQKYGYNRSSGGEVNSGFHLSEETKRKLSQAAKGKKLSEKHRLALIKANTGSHRSEETKRKISIANSHPKSEETKLKVSIAKQGQGAIPIIQYDLNGNYIREWESAFKAMKELKLPSRSCIANVLSGRCKQTHGYIFKYKDINRRK